MSAASHPRSDDARSALLRAAISEFAAQGEAGARTDAIAKAAGVNKALLHYYFGTKESLYAAVLDTILAGLKERYLGLLEGPGTAGWRMLLYVLANFDRMAASGDHARILGHEMMRARAGTSASLPRMVQAYFGPLHAVVCRTLEEGVRSGEFQPLEPSHMALSLAGANLFYFLSAPVFSEITGRDPRDPELLARRRSAILDHAASLVFADREAGRALARKVLADPPSSVPEP
ncbi:MAG TPA: TetR/AcrR family transcriptional regulator [Holophagaceae bacterium]